MLADSVGIALLVVLETLTPAERLAFVLHDMFDLPFEEIALIVGRTPAAARQLASRARRRIQGTSAERKADEGRQRSAVQAFLAASREGNFAALLELLDPEVVLRADTAAVKASKGKWGASPLSGSEIRGARAVAGALSGGLEPRSSLSSMARREPPGRPAGSHAPPSSSAFRMARSRKSRSSSNLRTFASSKSRS